MTQFTVPGLTEKQGTKIADLLQKQLSTYNDLHLTLKHVHWNVVGPSFIGVHEMIDPQVDLVRGYADEVAERIATLGGSPQGTPGAILKDRTWDDYSVGRDTVPAHLAALDLAAELEKFQWFVRAHLENAGGGLTHEGASTEKSAAKSARSKG
jgi:starvation-inducible DNA-binding protein